MQLEDSGTGASLRGLTDTHCHLNHEAFDADRSEAVQRARSAGIERLLVVGYDLASSRLAVSMAQGNADIQAVIGIHPEAIEGWSDEAASELVVLAQSNPGKIAAWGEIGLDYHWQSATQDAQKAAFKAQLRLAASLDLAAVIHCRDAYDDVLGILNKINFNRAVLHCFTGTAEHAAKALAAGLYLGVGGIATFKKSEELRAIYSDLSTPVERLILETDAPYLAPQAWRGKRNEPAYLPAVAELLSEIRNSTKERNR